MRPRFTIVIPFHWMENWQFFLTRALESVCFQTFTDYEVVLTKSGKMAENTNAAMKAAKGELIKILFMDDYLSHENALQVISDNFKEGDHFLATGCLHQQDEEDAINPHIPTYTHDIHTGNNSIGSPSVITLRNDGKLLFDERLSYMLDCDLYKRYHDRYGLKLIDDLGVVIGLHDGQTSNIMTGSEKIEEAIYTIKKHT